MPGRIVKVAATQQSCSWDIEANLVCTPLCIHRYPDPRFDRIPCRYLQITPQAQAEKHVREAAAQGANIILLQVMPHRCSSLFAAAVLCWP